MTENIERFVFEKNRYFGEVEGKIKFIANILALDLMKVYQFKTMIDSEEIFVYNNGIYTNIGTPFIKSKVEGILQNSANTARVNEVIEHIKRKTFTDRARFNSDKNLICMTNGIFVLDKEELIPHSPEYLFTSKIPIKFDSNIKCENIIKFLSEIVSHEDVDALLELFGYLLLRDYPIQKAFMFLGAGANGKTTLINLYIAFIGKENVASVPLQDIDKKRFSLASLFGRLANICADISSSTIDDAEKFKLLTGGDIIEAEKKFKDSFCFRNYAKLIFSANKLPPTKDNSYAYHRRWRIIRFPNTFVGTNADKDILEKLTTEQELSGLFNLVIPALKSLLKNGDFSNDRGVEETQYEYNILSSPIRAFAYEYLNFAPDSKTLKEDVYTSYLTFCLMNEVPELDSNAFGRKFKECFGEQIFDCRIGLKNAYGGVKLKQPSV